MTRLHTTCNKPCEARVQEHNFLGTEHSSLSLSLSLLHTQTSTHTLFPLTFSLHYSLFPASISLSFRISNLSLLHRGILLLTFMWVEDALEIKLIF